MHPPPRPPLTLNATPLRPQLLMMHLLLLCAVFAPGGHTAAVNARRDNLEEPILSAAADHVKIVKDTVNFNVFRGDSNLRKTYKSQPRYRQYTGENTDNAEYKGKKYWATHPPEQTYFDFNNVSPLPSYRPYSPSSNDADDEGNDDANYMPAPLLPISEDDDYNEESSLSGYESLDNAPFESVHPEQLYVPSPKASRNPDQTSMTFHKQYPFQQPKRQSTENKKEEAHHNIPHMAPLVPMMNIGDYNEGSTKSKRCWNEECRTTHSRSYARQHYDKSMYIEKIYEDPYEEIPKKPKPSFRQSLSGSQMPEPSKPTQSLKPSPENINAEIEKTIKDMENITTLLDGMPKLEDAIEQGQPRMRSREQNIFVNSYKTQVDFLRKQLHTCIQRYLNLQQKLVQEQLKPKLRSNIDETIDEDIKNPLKRPYKDIYASTSAINTEYQKGQVNIPDNEQKYINKEQNIISNEDPSQQHISDGRKPQQTPDDNSERARQSSLVSENMQRYYSRNSKPQLEPNKFYSPDENQNKNPSFNDNTMVKNLINNDKSKPTALKPEEMVNKEVKQSETREQNNLQEVIKGMSNSKNEPHKTSHVAALVHTRIDTSQEYENGLWVGDNFERLEPLNIQDVYNNIDQPYEFLAGQWVQIKPVQGPDSARIQPNGATDGKVVEVQSKSETDNEAKEPKNEKIMSSNRDQPIKNNASQGHSIAEVNISNIPPQKGIQFQNTSLSSQVTNASKFQDIAHSMGNDLPGSHDSKKLGPVFQVSPVASNETHDLVTHSTNSLSTTQDDSSIYTMSPLLHIMTTLYPNLHKGDSEYLEQIEPVDSKRISISGNQQLSSRGKKNKPQTVDTATQTESSTLFLDYFTTDENGAGSQLHTIALKTSKENTAFNTAAGIKAPSKASAIQHEKENKFGKGTYNDLEKARANAATLDEIDTQFNNAKPTTPGYSTDELTTTTYVVSHANVEANSPVTISTLFPDKYLMQLSKRLPANTANARGNFKEDIIKSSMNEENVTTQSSTETNSWSQVSSLYAQLQSSHETATKLLHKLNRQKGHDNTATQFASSLPLKDPAAASSPQTNEKINEAKTEGTEFIGNNIQKTTNIPLESHLAAELTTGDASLEFTTKPNFASYQYSLPEQTTTEKYKDSASPRRNKISGEPLANLLDLNANGAFLAGRSNAGLPEERNLKKGHFAFPQSNSDAPANTPNTSAVSPDNQLPSGRNVQHDKAAEKQPAVNQETDKFQNTQHAQQPSGQEYNTLQRIPQSGQQPLAHSPQCPDCGWSSTVQYPSAYGYTNPWENYQYGSQPYNYYANYWYSHYSQYTPTDSSGSNDGTRITRSVTTESSPLFFKSHSFQTFEPVSHITEFTTENTQQKDVPQHSKYPRDAEMQNLHSNTATASTATPQTWFQNPLLKVPVYDEYQDTSDAYAETAKKDAGKKTNYYGYLPRAISDPTSQFTQPSHGKTKGNQQDMEILFHNPSFSATSPSSSSPLPGINRQYTQTNKNETKQQISMNYTTSLNISHTITDNASSHEDPVCENMYHKYLMEVVQWCKKEMDRTSWRSCTSQCIVTETLRCNKCMKNMIKGRYGGTKSLQETLKSFMENNYPKQKKEEGIVLKNAHPCESYANAKLNILAEILTYLKKLLFTPSKS